MSDPAPQAEPSGRPVQIGRMLFTMVDPNPGYEVAYNRWYERDHFYGGCLVGPWLFAGKRWVATRALKDLRFPPVGPFAEPADAGSYLAVYWVHAGHEDEHFAWARRQVYWLYQHGHGFNERTHAHTKLYDLEEPAIAIPTESPQARPRPRVPRPCRDLLGTGRGRDARGTPSGNQPAPRHAAGRLRHGHGLGLALPRGGG